MLTYIDAQKVIGTKKRAPFLVLFLLIGRTIVIIACTSAGAFYHSPYKSKI